MRKQNYHAVIPTHPKGPTENLMVWPFKIGLCSMDICTFNHDSFDKFFTRSQTTNRFWISAHTTTYTSVSAGVQGY